MTFNEYQQRSAATAGYPAAYKIQYAIVGLADEMDEVLEKIGETAQGSWGEILKEVGDVYWYCAAVLRDLDFESEYQTFLEGIQASDYGWAYDVGRPVRDGIVASGKILGLLKKSWRDGYNLETKRFEIISYVLIILEALEKVCFHLDSSPEAVWEANLEKLFDRKDRGVLGGSGDNR